MEKGLLGDSFDPALKCVPLTWDQDLIMGVSLKIKGFFSVGRFWSSWPPMKTDFP